MLLSNKTYPAGTLVSVMCSSDGRVRVKIRNTKPAPDWLVTRDESKIEEDLIALITSQPNRAFSYYTRLPLIEGGIKGSQERKEIVLKRLIDSGIFELKQLDKPVGRIKHIVTLLQDKDNGNG